MMHEVETYSVRELFNSDQYRIPIYQRNYAWGKAEISQLIQDILDYIPENRKYYIGTLVVFRHQNEADIFFDTIDGQQRLTTLSILLSVLRNEYDQVDWFKKKILSFESRPLSQQALDFAFNGYFSGNKEYHFAIKEAYDHIQSDVKVKLSEASINVQDFVNFLCEQVTILRVEVPHDTDLNHYFEIMNNRGEQLEKHEVVKSLLLDALFDEADDHNDQLQELFQIIWEAAQQVERYIQFGFEPKLRQILFGKEWSYLQIADEEELLETYFEFVANVDTEGSSPLTVDDILNNNTVFDSNENKEESFDRFTSPINFQNFLLHILKIQTGKNEIALDDKRLIDFFKGELRGKNNAQQKTFVVEFMFNILRGKWLMDTYVIKRQFLANKEGWSLLTLKSNDGKKSYYLNSFSDDDDDWDNQYIVMLLSMFHVSTPTMIYKHWLNAALYYLMSVEEVVYEDYREYLEKIVKQLVCFRFLETDVNKKLEYHDLIYNPKKLAKAYPKINYNNIKFQYANIENNLLFNFLDYVIWDIAEDNIAKKFEFTFRSSIEHYYPQNPIGGKKLEDEKALHSFGNLCLISHQKNSKLNHHLPSAKKNYYAKLSTGGLLIFDSLKQHIMMTEYDADEWDEDGIRDHHKKMVDLMNAFIQDQ